MIKDITFGQYFVADSLIHKLDPRLKIILMLVLVVTLFLCGGFLSLGIMTLFTIFLIIISRISLKLYFKNIKVIVPIVIFTSLINLFYTQTGTEYHLFWKISIWTGGIEKAIFMSLRILVLILISSILTYTTTPNDITDAIERLLSPLKFIGLGSAVHSMSMMMTIALRFIPTLIDETDKIMNAQKARGADLESGGLLQRIKALLPILIPLLISSVRRAYDLAEAMECRCYNGGKGRRRMKQLKFSARDFLSILGVVLILTTILFITFYFKW